MKVKKIDLGDVKIYVEKKKKKKGNAYYYIVYAKDKYGFAQTFGRFKNKRTALERAKELERKFRRML